MEVLLALVILVVGSALSWQAAATVAHHAAATSRHGFDTAAGEVAWNLRSELVHEQDLVVGAAAHLSENPDLTNSQFSQFVSGEGHVPL